MTVFFGAGVAVGRNPTGLSRGRGILTGLAFALVMSALAGCNNTAAFNDAAPKAAALSPPPSEANALQSTTTPGAAGTATGTTSGTATAESSQQTRSKHRRRHSSATTSGSATASSASKGRDRGTATKNAEFVEQGAAQSETYPKFVPPKAATTQMTDAEKKAFEEQMAARMKANAAPKDETPAEYAERMKLMRALAAEHGPDTLKAIKNQ